jgi:phage gpG-like protein
MQLLISADDTGKRAAKRFERLEKNMGDTRPMFEEIAALVAEKGKARFRSVKLQPSTIEWKAKYGQSSEPLVESGRMRDELTTAKGIKMISSTELRFGSSSPATGEGRGRAIPAAKAALIEKGTKHQKKHLILRPTPTTRVAIAELVKEKLFKE